MPFTTVVVSHSWQNADSTPSSGNVTFQLSKSITNGSLTLVPNHVVVTLNASGAISQPLVSNIDAGTIPLDSFWTVTERIMGAGERQYHVQLPSASAGALTVDLGSVMPGITPIEPG